MFAATTGVSDLLTSSLPPQQILASSSAASVPAAVAAQAEQLYRRALEAGDKAALNNLALLLEITGRSGEAEHYLRQAIDAGDSNALVNLATLLLRRDPGLLSGRGERTTEVRDLLARAADAGITPALLMLAGLADADSDQAEHCYRQAAESGSVAGRNMLFLLLAERRKIGQACEMFAEMLARADPRDFDSLHALLSMQNWSEGTDALRRVRANPDAAHIKQFVTRLAERLAP